MLIYDKNKVILKDLKYIHTLNDEKIILQTKTNQVLIKGESLEIDYMEYNEVHVCGIIKEIQFNEK